MADLSRRQFGKYTLSAAQGPNWGPIHVSASAEDEYGDEVPVGGMTIRSSQKLLNDVQERINDPRQIGFRHGISEEPGGQLRWNKGNFEDPHTKVAGLWASEGHRNPALLSALAAVGFHMAGHIPYADDMLSVEGAKTSRHMAKAFGMQGHPDNPNMEANWHPTDEGYGPSDPDVEDDEYRREAMNEYVDSELHHIAAAARSPSNRRYGGGDPSVRALVDRLKTMRTSYKPEPWPKKEYENPIDRWLEEPPEKPLKGQMNLPGI